MTEMWAIHKTSNRAIRRGNLASVAMFPEAKEGESDLHKKVQIIRVKRTLVTL